jgi:hypothetical protein
MDGLIGRLDAVVGVDRTAAEKAVGIIPQSARSWGDPRSWSVRQMFDPGGWPGARRI